MIAYVCKYTPIELFAGFGATSSLLDSEAPDFEYAESLTHANLCSHAKAILQQAAQCKEVVLTDCCDSMRRTFDALESQSGQEYLELMDLPHEIQECSIDRLAGEFQRLARSYAAKSNRKFDREAFLDACRKAHEQAIDPAQINEPFFAVMGARMSSELMDQVRNELGCTVVDLTCSGTRNLEEPPDNADELGFSELMKWYAGALLRMLPCMRMADVSNRRQLTENPHLVGIVYNTVKFCDYYGFDYQQLIETSHIPVLKIESDYTPMPSGQLSTRLQAFAEAFGLSSSSDKAEADEEDSTKENKIRENSMPKIKSSQYIAGIDSGSTTTNMVVLDQEGTIAATAIVRTGPKASRGAQEALDEVCAKLGVGADAIPIVMATGYGRFNIPFATDTLTEITCHARGAHALNPEIRCIVDIGGQDSKVICLDYNGNVVNFIMNDKCAAGTGRFLEAMARTLELDLSQMSRMGLSWDKDLTISSMCTVFAESEVISLIADNHTDSDIIHGLNKSIASRTASMVKRAKGSGPFMMTGGVARNRGVVEELERRLGSQLYIAENPDLCGAYGAALFAVQP